MNTFKRFRLWIALVVLLLPLVLRTVWFYQGLPSQPKIQSPNYAAQTIPQPPVSTAAPASVTMKTGKIVILDYTHSNQFSPSEIEYFTAALTKRGARVEIDDGYSSLANRLKYASAYLVFSPTTSFSSEEINLIRNFVARGGRLVVFTDPTRGTTGFDYFTGSVTVQPDVDSANPLLAPFGIRVDKDYLYNLVRSEGNFRNILFDRIGENKFTSGLTQVAFYGTHSIHTDDGTPLIIGDKDTYSSISDAGGNLAAAALSANGNVLAFGDFSFLIPPYNTVADNDLLIGRIADFLLAGTRIHSLADFPYVFDREVYTVPTGGLQLTADLLGPVASLQNVLKANSTSLLINPEPPESGDRLIIGLLDPSEDLTPYLDPFHLELEDSSKIVVPDFGTVSRTGIGLLLFQRTDTRNTLIVLADVPSDLPSLIGLLAQGDLSACVIQGDVAMCGIGYGGSYFEEATPFDFQPTGEPSLYEVTPTPIPPPG